jgi:hypothetical protein
MWEEITPLDERAQHAYLDGVDRSDLFILLLGTRYGEADETGFSPTHKEGKRALERGIPRLLFEPTHVARNEHDGRLNDWLASLYHEISGGKYDDSSDLVRKLANRVRGVASAQETPWIKLGRLVMPGTVGKRGGAGTTTYEVRTRLRDLKARQAITLIADRFHQSDADRLTWGVETTPIARVQVETHTSLISEVEATLVCERDTRRGGATLGGGMTINGIGPAEQVGIWADYALFGKSPERDQRRDPASSMMIPQGPTLPNVLKAHEARGWLAEGLARLYIVEGLMTKFGGHFERLDVGPATAATVRVSMRFFPESHELQSAEVIGLIPLT